MNSHQPITEPDTYLDMMGGDDELRLLANKIKALSVSDSEDDDDLLNKSSKITLTFTLFNCQMHQGEASMTSYSCELYDIF